MRAAFTRAGILPRSFYFVSVRDINGTIDPDRLYSVETDPEQAEDAKPPYDTVKMKGRVEGRFIFSTALSRHLLPFALVSPPPILLGFIYLTPLTVKRASSGDYVRFDTHRALRRIMGDRPVF
jgi:hypothetical protein